MHRYAVAVVGADVGVGGAAICALRAGTNVVRLEELWIAVAGGVGTVGNCRLVRSTAVGTATTSVLGQAEDPASPPSLANVDTAWSVAPTLATNEQMRWPGAGTVTPGPSVTFMWPWPGRGIVIPANGSIVLHSTDNMAQPVVTWVWREPE